MFNLNNIRTYTAIQWLRGIKSKKLCTFFIKTKPKVFFLAIYLRLKFNFYFLKDVPHNNF